MLQKVAKNSPKFAKKFHCEKCDYTCFKKSDYEKHLESKKHNATKCYIDATENSLQCLCGKKYKHHSSFYRHKKKCKIWIENLENKIEISENLQKISENLENSKNSEILKHSENIEKTEYIENSENSENIEKTENLKNKDSIDFKELLIQSMEVIKKKDEQLDKLIPLISESKIINNTTNNTNNNTTNNNQFNINVFLNDTCKDALNLMDFVDSLKLQLKDLETTGKLGYVEGVSQIFRDGLNSLELTKRPIHCIKNDESIYVKENDIWDKELEDKSIIKKAIENVGKNNFKQIPNWVDENPDCVDSGTNKNLQYMKIIENSITNNQHDVEKIIENIKNEVIIKNE